MESTKLDSLIRRYEEVYFFATRKIFALISEQVQDDLTTEQYFALRHVRRFGPCSSSDLALHCNVNRSAITAMVDRLASKSYIRRARDRQDRRVIRLHCTAKGETVIARGEEKIRKFVQSYLQELEEHEMEQFIRIYEKIAAIIQHPGEGN